MSRGRWSRWRQRVGAGSAEGSTGVGAVGGADAVSTESLRARDVAVEAVGLGAVLSDPWTSLEGV
jgi:hypothetical protein